MYELLTSVILPPLRRSVPTAMTADTDTDTESSKPRPRHDIDETQNRAAIEREATLLTATHLLSPLVFTISTRGSSESVLSLFVLSTLYCALTARWDAAAVLLGISTHWKIYPFVYGVACLGVISGVDGRKTWRAWAWSMVNHRTMRFGVLSAGVFFLLGGAMYAV